jgi:hypothetical protein
MRPRITQPVVGLVRCGQEFDGRAKHVKNGTVGSLGDVAMKVVVAG